METAQVNTDKKLNNSKVLYAVNNRLDTHIYVHMWVCVLFTVIIWLEANLDFKSLIRFNPSRLPGVSFFTDI